MEGQEDVCHSKKHIEFVPLYVDLDTVYRAFCYRLDIGPDGV